MMATNLIVNWLPEQYALIHQALYQHGIPHERMITQNLPYKVFSEDEADYTKQSAILIGSVCHNSDIAHLLDVIDCKSYFKPGEGMVKLIRENDKFYVLFTGYSGDEVLAVTRVFLSQLQLRKVEGTELRIDSTTNIPLRDPQWFGPYSSPSVRTTRTREANVLGSRFYIFP